MANRSNWWSGLLCACFGPRFDISDVDWWSCFAKNITWSTTWQVHLCRVRPALNAAGNPTGNISADTGPSRQTPLWSGVAIDSRRCFRNFSDRICKAFIQFDTSAGCLDASARGSRDQVDPNPAGFLPDSSGCMPSSCCQQPRFWWGLFSDDLSMHGCMRQGGGCEDSGCIKRGLWYGLVCKWPYSRMYRAGWHSEPCLCQTSNDWTYARSNLAREVQIRVNTESSLDEKLRQNVRKVIEDFKNLVSNWPISKDDINTPSPIDYLKWIGQFPSRKWVVYHRM